jgi:hypothetical protein
VSALRAGPKPVRFLDAATFGSCGRPRSTGFPVTRCFHRAAPSVSNPPEPLTSRIGSLPAAHRLVPYQLDTQRALRQAGEPAVLQQQSNLGDPHPSVRSARRDQLRSDSGETRGLTTIPTQLGCCEGSGHNRKRRIPPPGRGRVVECHARLPWWSPEGGLRRSLGGHVRSGQSDIEATSGAELVSPRGRRPQHARVSARADSPITPHGSNGPRSALPASRSRLTAIQRRIAGRPRTRQPQVERATGITPQRASEFSSGSETLPPLCCLTRNQQLPPQQVRSLLPAPVHPRRGIEDDPFTVAVKATNEPEEPNDDTRPTRRRIVT